MLAIVFATADEAAPFIRESMEGRFDGVDEGDRIRSGDRLVTISGEGKIKATLATEHLLQKYEPDVLVHAGGAVSLSENVETGSVLGATHVLEGDRVHLQDPSYPRMPLELPFPSVEKGTLVTQDHISEDREELSYWERIADARDSTGYCVAYVAGQHGTSCHILKGITARVGHEKNSNDQQAAYEALAAVLDRELETLSTESGD